ncbi:MAG: hypothetical protein WC222_03100 [Parachlamydiales bacterium]
MKRHLQKYYWIIRDINTRWCSPLFWLLAMLGSVLLRTGTLTGSIYDKDPFIQNIHSRVIETIKHSDSVPGLKSEEFNTLKAGLLERWNALIEKGVFEITASDQEVRPYFVALQGIVEHVLSNELGNSVRSLTGVIHTPMPATPLCTKGNVSEELVDSSIEKDPLRLFTVKARTTIIRDYLFHGGDLYVVYPKEGLTKRTAIQQQIYKNELNTYPSHLFDRPLDCECIDNDLIGASYLFKTSDGKLFAFAIKIPQANSPQELGCFGLWFGEFEITTPAYVRISFVLESILKHSSKPIALPDS